MVALAGPHFCALYRIVPISGIKYSMLNCRSWTVAAWMAQHRPEMVLNPKQSNQIGWLYRWEIWHMQWFIIEPTNEPPFNSDHIVIHLYLRSKQSILKMFISAPKSETPLNYIDWLLFHFMIKTIFCLVIIQRKEKVFSITVLDLLALSSRSLQFLQFSVFK